MQAPYRLLIFALALPLTLNAQDELSDLPKRSGEGVVHLSGDDPVMARLDDLALLPWIKHSQFTADTAELNIHGFPAEHIPVWSERVYQQRLNILDGTTPFDLAHNKTIQAYIDLYAVRKRETSSRMLGLAELYFPIFEEYLDRHGMPMELKYLAVVESALNPNARSKAGAVGLWQFMLPTGKMFGLHADTYVDERHDIHKSTEAACKYLKYLYNMYGNWEMALAAYNCGPGNVNKAIRRSGGEKKYWKIYDHLPRETRGYVPAFVAVNYIFAHAADHNLYPVAPTYCAYEVDTVQVCYPLDLNSLSEIIGGSVAEIRALNPTFKLGLIPDIDQPVSLYLPREVAHTYVENEETIQYARMNSAAIVAEAKATAQPASQKDPAVVERRHTVRSGESLGVIARRYGVRVSDLKRWNGLRSDMIRAGQKLIVKTTPKADSGSTVGEAVRTFCPLPLNDRA